MKLYTTPTSPYGRMARMVIIEKGLSAKVEILAAETRTPGSPYYMINPSGRVPFLVRDDGVGIEDSQLITQYLDSLDGKPRLTPSHTQQDWAYGRLETYARSMLDGISVYLREMRRPENERSPTILKHEADRAKRLADFWEREIGHPMMQGPLNLAQVLLIVALDTGARARIGDLESGRAKLSVWARKVREQPSVKATAT
ncbi:MAG: glutathione S-transferase family protein [Hyphomicrobiaceae bacterium]